MTAFSPTLPRHAVPGFDRIRHAAGDTGRTLRRPWRAWFRQLWERVDDAPFLGL